MPLEALIDKNTLKKVFCHRNVTAEYLKKKTQCSSLLKVNEWFDPTVNTLPTFIQAKKIAEILTIPFAALYMHEDILELKKLPRIVNLRTIPDSYDGDESALNIAIIDLLNKRDLLYSLSDELGETIPKFNMQIEGNLTPVSIANKIKSLFNISLNDQIKLSSPRQLYLYIRNRVENKGIFVQGFKGVDIEMARGLAIYFNTMPIIGINDNDSNAAKTFSIIHELVHILKHQSVCCSDFYGSFSKSNEEVLCNAVAGELLVPQQTMSQKINAIQKSDIDFEVIEILEKTFLVSKEVIVRRLLDTSQINRAQYYDFIKIIRGKHEEKKQQLKNLRATGKKIFPGKASHLSAFDRTSEHLSMAFLKGLESDILSMLDISQYLGIKYDKTDLFLTELLKCRM
jgi:Zn-dependent peptidase ImmA (M78 family)